MCVTFNHLTLSLYPSILNPAAPKDRISSPWQQPFLMLFFTGFPWVATFLVVSGWVNALKPLGLMRTEHHQDRATAAASSLATNAIRRILRLVLPVTLAGTLAWAMAQAGAFSVGGKSANFWLWDTSPQPSGGVVAAVLDLFFSYYTTWALSWNVYDKNLWCMEAFLWCSLTLFTVLLVTSRMKVAARRLVLLGMFVWAWRTRNGMFLLLLSNK